MATMKKWKPGTPMGRKKGKHGPTMGPGAGKPPVAPPARKPPSTAPKVIDDGGMAPRTGSRELGGATPVTGRSTLAKKGGFGSTKKSAGSGMKPKSNFGYLPWNR